MARGGNANTRDIAAAIRIGCRAGHGDKGSMNTRPACMVLAAALLVLSAAGCAATRIDAGILAGNGEKQTPAVSSAPAGPRITALTNGLLIDGTGAEPVADAVVVIRDDRIQRVGRRGGISIPNDAKVLDVQGATILPGFINAHVHRSLDETVLREWARSGVTTVRDMTANADELLACSELQRDDRMARVVMVGGPISTPGGYGSPGALVDSPECAREKVIELIGAGADLVKIGIEDDLPGWTWQLPSKEVILAVVETAHERNIPVTAHVSRARHVEMAVAAGVDDLGHMAVDDLPDCLIAAVIERDIYWVPTLELWRGVSRMHSLDWDTKASENLRRFVAAGGKVALGTDYGGYICEFDLGMPVTEMQLMRDAGMTPMQIIVAGTSNAAHVCGLDDQLGTVEPGKIADVIVVGGNPTEDIAALANIQMVIHNGTVIRRPEGDSVGCAPP